MQLGVDTSVRRRPSCNSCVIALNERRVLVDLGDRGFNIVIRGSTDGVELLGGLLERSGHLRCSTQNGGLSSSVTWIRTPIGKTLKQLIQRCGDGTGGRNVEDILQRRERSLQLLELAEQRSLLSNRGFREFVASVLRVFLDATKQPVLRLKAQ